MKDLSPESPEGRRKRFAKAKGKFGRHVERVRPGSYPFEVIKRVAVGVYSDGFIHAHLHELPLGPAGAAAAPELMFRGFEER